MVSSLRCCLWSCASTTASRIQVRYPSPTRGACVAAPSRSWPPPFHLRVSLMLFLTPLSCGSRSARDGQASQRGVTSQRHASPVPRGAGVAAATVWRRRCCGRRACRYLRVPHVAGPGLQQRDTGGHHAGCEAVAVCGRQHGRVGVASVWHAAQLVMCTARQPQCGGACC